MISPFLQEICESFSLQWKRTATHLYRLAPLVFESFAATDLDIFCVISVAYLDHFLLSSSLYGPSPTGALTGWITEQ